MLNITPCEVRTVKKNNNITTGLAYNHSEKVRVNNDSLLNRADWSKPQL